MAEPRQGNIPQAMPFHRGLPLASAYCHMRPIAVTHSITDEVWTAQVGNDSALAGSAWTLSAAAGSAIARETSAAAARQLARGASCLGGARSRLGWAAGAAERRAASSWGMASALWLGSAAVRLAALF